MRPDRDQERKNAIRRDMIMAGVAVALFAGLGAFLTFMSADAARLFQSVGAVLFDQPAPAMAPQPKQVTAAPVKGCKYCQTLKTIQHNFAAKAKAAQDLQDSALKASRSGGTEPNGVKRAPGASRADLAAATDSFERFAAAAAALKPFVDACEQESFCQPGFLPAKAAQTCEETAEDAGWRGPAMGLAAVAREAALSCIAQSCPSIDCGAATNLRQNLVDAAQALSVVGGPVALAKGQPRLKDLPVGAAALSNEVAKAIKDVAYAAQLYPALIERPDKPALERAAQMPAMVADMAARQSEAMRNAADVMLQAAVVTPYAQDARRESAWRMKALSLSIAEAGKMSAIDLLNGPDGKAYRIALSQNWGAALVDLAAASAFLDRVNAYAMAPSGCNGQTAIAAQAVRDAAALLDICRARAACPIGAGVRSATPARTVDDARAALADLIPRGQAAGDVFAASQVGAAPPDQAATELAQAASVLNAGGVCQPDQSPQ